jgi:hypothetical protein
VHCPDALSDISMFYNSGYPIDPEIDLTLEPFPYWLGDLKMSSAAAMKFSIKVSAI